MKIIDAQYEDLEEILALQREAFTREAKEFNNWTIDPMVQPLEALQEQFKTNVFLKAVDEDGTIVGSARGHRAGGTSYIGRTFVKPSHQGQGIGTALIHALEARNPAERYEINSSIQCPQNIRLYEHLGFVRFKETREERNGFVYLEKFELR